MKGDETFLEMLREAVDVLRGLPAPLADLHYDLDLDAHPPRIAHAFGILEGAGVTLGLTMLELLDAYDLLEARDVPVPARRSRRTPRAD